MIHIAKECYGFNKAIEIEELLAIYPECRDELAENYGSEYLYEKQ
jgi:hypothetical protein